MGQESWLGPGPGRAEEGCLNRAQAISSVVLAWSFLCKTFAIRHLQTGKKICSQIILLLAQKTAAQSLPSQLPEHG
jgi:hypothetical protein